MKTIKIGKNNPIFQEIKRLYKKNDKEYIFIEDLNSLEIALKYNKEFVYFIYSDDIPYHPDTMRIIDQAISISQKVYSMSNSLFNSFAIKDNAIGFMAFINLKTDDLNILKNKDFLVICDRIEIPGNLGTIYRTMDSAKVSGMILVDPITKFSSPKLVTSSRGTNMIIPTVSLSFDDAVNFLIDNNYDIFLGEPNLGLDYQAYDYKGKIAIVVGNERFGINPLWYNYKHKKVFIPMEGNNNSLNVGVAASILIYEAYMKRKK